MRIGRGVGYVAMARGKDMNAGMTTRSRERSGGMKRLRRSLFNLAAGVSAVLLVVVAATAVAHHFRPVSVGTPSSPPSPASTSGRPIGGDVNRMPAPAQCDGCGCFDLRGLINAQQTRQYTPFAPA